MLLSTILFNDLSLESQFVSLLTVSEEIIKATTLSRSEDDVPCTTAKLLHLFPELGCSHLASVCRIWTRSSLQPTASAQILTPHHLKRGRRRERKLSRSTKWKPFLVTTPTSIKGTPLVKSVSYMSWTAWVTLKANTVWMQWKSLNSFNGSPTQMNFTSGCRDGCTA